MSRYCQALKTMQIIDGLLRYLRSQRFYPVKFTKRSISLGPNDLNDLNDLNDNNALDGASHESPYHRHHRPGWLIPD